ncbi:MAG: SprT-like domain-containing protein [Bacteroidales bacterium]|nr:SprT-like domain-containing protein [Bacteroidales bacterium]
MWYIVILTLLAMLCLAFITPSLFDTDTAEVPRHNAPKTGQKPVTKKKNSKTDPRINKMLAECTALLKELNVPISSSVCPTVKLIGTKRTLGRCCKKGGSKSHSEYEYYIEISRYTLNNPEKSIRNTLIHELLHTVPHGMCHTGEWKKWAKYVSQKTGHTIQRLAEYKNE